MSDRDKELYKQLRARSWDELWAREVPRFNTASARERFENVATIRAVSVAFAEGGKADRRGEVKEWLRSLLEDEQEKIRRYAVAALPKLGGDPQDERALIALLRRAANDREREAVAEALSLLGGNASLREQLPSDAELRLRAKIAGAESAGELNPHALLNEFIGIDIHLWCRSGLEEFVHAEAQELIVRHHKFRIQAQRRALIVLRAIKPFSLADLFSLRCFGFLAFALQGRTKSADLIASTSSLSILKAFTNGPLRYRLEFIGKGHQRAAVRELAGEVFGRNPNLLNSGAGAPWTIAVRRTVQQTGIELRPRMAPDPRFNYRQGDVPAASHPPLAACMARLAGRGKGDVAWDPFCGSGLELIEFGLFAKPHRLIGSDLSSAAIETARANCAAAKIYQQPEFACTDFRNFDPGPVTAIITNPPLGKRVPLPSVKDLIKGLLDKAARHLVTGGRLVFVNPLREPIATPSLKREFSQIIDMGGFDCRLEKYSKQ